MIYFFSVELNGPQSIISQQIKPKLQNIFQKVLRSLNELSYDIWDQHSLHIYVPIARKTIFIFRKIAGKTTILNTATIKSQSV